jgi:DNA-binding transcriptional ArsR family regulator
MPVQAGFSQIAAALADPAREAMLAALADGRALPAGELATIAGVSPQSASAHLQRLVGSGILAVWKQGKFRYYRMAGEPAAEVIEALANFARKLASPRPRARTVEPDFGFARCCYSHLAGSLGVELGTLLVRRGYVRIAHDQAELTERGRRWATEQGFLAGPARRGRPELRLCLDWTERRHHLAGRIPSAILQSLLEQGHLRRGRQRVLHLTASGKAWFAALAASEQPPDRYQPET